MIIVTALFAVATVAPTAAASPAPAVPTMSGPVVVLETTMGDIRIALDEAKAPVTVKNYLAYVRAGHYDGTIFHRVIPRFMVQAGGMDAAMKERPTRAPIKNEAANKLRNDRGMVAMARTADPNSATAQFFINLKNNASLDYGVGGAGYAVFGTVIDGMDVVDRIVAVPTTGRSGHQDVPVTPVLINKARVEGAARAPAGRAPESIEKPAPARPASMPRLKPSARATEVRSPKVALAPISIETLHQCKAADLEKALKRSFGRAKRFRLVPELDETPTRIEIVECSRLEQHKQTFTSRGGPVKGPVGRGIAHRG